MSDLKDAILDAKYIDMISLGDFVVRDCGLPDMDADGNLMPQANEIAAALFRWAADMQADGGAPVPASPASVPAPAPEATPEPMEDPVEEVTPEADSDAEDKSEYDEFGDPVMDAVEAERLEETREAEAEETA